MRRFNSPKVIMITGAAGYIGAMLCHQFSKSPDLEKIIAIDMQTMPAILKDNKKVVWLTADLLGNVWKVPSIINKPEVIIHAATEDNEEHISRAVSDFFYNQNFAKKLIYLSDIAGYGAEPENDSSEMFTELDDFCEEEYLPGLRKKLAEARLKALHEASGESKQVYVLRSAAVTGPRGRSMEPDNMLPFIPSGSDKWCRQFIHEDDLTDIVGMFTFGGRDTGGCYEVYNLAPSDTVGASRIATARGVSSVKIPPIFLRPLCHLAWKISSSKVSTPPGAWRYLSYPIVADGSLITKKYGFEYYYTSDEALAKDEGRYAESVE